MAGILCGRAVTKQRRLPRFSETGDRRLLTQCIHPLRRSCAHLQQGLHVQMSDGWDLVREDYGEVEALARVPRDSFRGISIIPRQQPGQVRQYSRRFNMRGINFLFGMNWRGWSSLDSSLVDISIRLLLQSALRVTSCLPLERMVGSLRNATS